MDSEGQEPVLRLRGTALEWRAVEGEVVALDIEQSTYVGTNRAGALLWSALARGATRRALLEQLCRTYDVAAATAERDLDSFLAEMRAQRLLGV